jgi:DUF1009 family protein
LIAGADRFPLLLAQRARARGKRVVAVAMCDVTSPELDGLVDVIEWAPVGRLDRIIGVFKRENVAEAYMAGGLSRSDAPAPRRALVHLPEADAMRPWLCRLQDRGAAAVLTAVADEMDQEGIRLRSSVELLEDQLASAGCMTGVKPGPGAREDLGFGWRYARDLARLDIGQTIVVKDRCIVAVEAVEGTDECVRRGGRLAGPGATLIKVSRPDQDMRFDVPCVGERTVAVCAESGLHVIALEARRTLMLDRERAISAADEAGIAIVGVTSDGSLDL